MQPGSAIGSRRCRHRWRSCHCPTHRPIWCGRRARPTSWDLTPPSRRDGGCLPPAQRWRSRRPSGQRPTRHRPYAPSGRPDTRQCGRPTATSERRSPPAGRWPPPICCPTPTGRPTTTHWPPGSRSCDSSDPVTVPGSTRSNTKSRCGVRTDAITATPATYCARALNAMRQGCLSGRSADMLPGEDSESRVHEPRRRWLCIGTRWCDVLGPRPRSRPPSYEPRIRR